MKTYQCHSCNTKTKSDLCSEVAQHRYSNTSLFSNVFGDEAIPHSGGAKIISTIWKAEYPHVHGM
jgi:DTW domain-containing protein YfiP